MRACVFYVFLNLLKIYFYYIFAKVLVFDNLDIFFKDGNNQVLHRKSF